ncbi:MAG TPA: hypothetical protein VGK32_05735 [Vicinamibacterales bacterium]|jgi:hypothetical protein
MATYRGFVQSTLVRDDGWVETVVKAVHAGNAITTFFIPNLDGDLTQAHKRLGQLSLLRDALARVEPVELNFTSDASQGNLIQDVTIVPRQSIDGRRGSRLVEGVVIGVSITERGPESGSSPYRDAPDLAAISLLRDDGIVEGLLLDLQRPDPGTGQAELEMIQRAHRTRRPLQLMVAPEHTPGADKGVKLDAATDGKGETTAAGYIQTCRFVVLPAADLDYRYAFIERLGQRYESYTAADALAASHVEVVCTTAPGQTPEGDVSDNGTFTPQKLTVLVHADSPLLALLKTALRDGLQVKLGLQGRDVHEVELVAGLGSSARPIWICTSLETVDCGHAGPCLNQPTISTPDGADLDRVERAVEWRGDGYFREGIWRFVVSAPGKFRLLIDAKPVCCEAGGTCGSPAGGRDLEVSGPGQLHAYLKDMHRVELRLEGYSCRATFKLQIYRIR